MIVEFVVGIYANSLALQADAMHMASDLIALLVAFWALSLSGKKSTDSYTYGWSRFEVMGAMINSVFLLSVCLNIVIEALTRFFDIGEVKDSMAERIGWNLAVSILGLLINVLGLFIFGCTGSDPHGHAHGHSHGHAHGHDHDHEEHEEHEHEHHDHDSVVVEMEPKKQPKRKRSSNIQAVVLHVMGDALGSVAAIASACIIRYLPENMEWRFYADPICSLLIVLLILHSCIPLFKSVTGILLQTAPKSINVAKLREAIGKTPGVESFHGLHIWQLNDDVNIGSVHIVCSHYYNHQKVMDDVKSIFHKANIHSSTVQVEVVRTSGEKETCNDIVCKDKNCLVHHCCAGQQIHDQMLKRENTY